MEFLFGLIFGYVFATSDEYFKTDDLKNIFSRDNNSTEIIKKKD